MGYSATIFLPDPDATDCLGQALSPLLRPGDTLLLDGEIGTGKTHLARAIIRTLLGAPEAQVPSPTFTLVQTYDLPNATLWHVDLYRLADPSEVIELGLDDALGRDIALIEWPEQLDDWPDNSLRIKFQVAGDGRRATLASDNQRWAALNLPSQAADA